MGLLLAEGHRSRTAKSTAIAIFVILSALGVYWW
ncbi:hypothetical protein ACUXPM_000996 [Ralstonia sp. 151470066-2]|jgi:hypothetical protein